MSKVAYIQNSSIKYPNFPYLPDQKYPEFIESVTDPTNKLYPQLRQLLADYKLDIENYGKTSWNPLKSFIKPGQKIVIKPNWVLHRNFGSGNVDCLITHTSLIRFIIDYILISLQDQGEIIIADAPLQACNFDQLIKQTKINDLLKIYKQKYKNVSFSVVDLRKTVYFNNQTHYQSGDIANGYKLINLGKDSLLEDISNQSHKFRVTMYNPKKLLRHHSTGKHEYLISKTILAADCLINLPKMKTHIKTGFTGAMKNTIGINGHKEYLPHHRYGSTQSGGDQFPKKFIILDVHNFISDYYWTNNHNLPDIIKLFFRLTLKALAFFIIIRKHEGYLDGGWPGNDTIPRTTIDLNNILINNHRKIIHIVDGIVAGEGLGPLKPDAKTVGIIMLSESASAIDYIMAMLIGYTPKNIHILNHALFHPKSLLKFRLSNLSIVRNGKVIKLSQVISLKFLKPQLWRTA